MIVTFVDANITIGVMKKFDLANHSTRKTVI